MPDIRHSVQIAATGESIRPLISSARGMAEWWAEDIQQKGDAIELGFFNRATVYRLSHSSRHRMSVANGFARPETSGVARVLFSSSNLTAMEYCCASPTPAGRLRPTISFPAPRPGAN